MSEEKFHQPENPQFSVVHEAIANLKQRLELHVDLCGSRVLVWLEQNVGASGLAVSISCGVQSRLE
eukprot:437428-Rhodomonas_salina.1